MEHSVKKMKMKMKMISHPITSAYLHISTTVSTEPSIMCPMTGMVFIAGRAICKKLITPRSDFIVRNCASLCDLKARDDSDVYSLASGRLHFIKRPLSLTSLCRKLQPHGRSRGCIFCDSCGCFLRCALRREPAATRLPSGSECGKGKHWQWKEGEENRATTSEEGREVVHDPSSCNATPTSRGWPEANDRYPVYLRSRGSAPTPPTPSDIADRTLNDRHPSPVVGWTSVGVILPYE
jgi:hypothetical protein